MEIATSFREKRNKMTRVLQAGSMFILVLLTPIQLFDTEIITDNEKHSSHGFASSVYF
jgi:hypothetical protein